MKIKDEIQRLYQYKKQIEKIEKKYEISICNIDEDHFILKNINKKIKIYIQVSDLESIHNLAKKMFGNNWRGKYAYFEKYAYIEINDILFFYLMDD